MASANLDRRSGRWSLTGTSRPIRDSGVPAGPNCAEGSS